MCVCAGDVGRRFQVFVEFQFDTLVSDRTVCVESMSEGTIVAVLQWVSRFDCNADRPCHSAQDLISGVALFDTLASLSPDFFDASAIQRAEGTVVSHTNNLKKLVTGMAALLESVGMMVDLHAFLNLSAIVRGGDVAELTNLLRCVAFCAVHTSQRQLAIEHIMALDEAMQGEMMVLISSGQEMFATFNAGAPATPLAAGRSGSPVFAALSPPSPSHATGDAGQQQMSRLQQEVQQSVFHSPACCMCDHSW